MKKGKVIFALVISFMLAISGICTVMAAEGEVQMADKVLLICDKYYAAKANARKVQWYEVKRVMQEKNEQNCARSEMQAAKRQHQSKPCP